MRNNELSETFFRPARREDASFLGRCVCEGIGYAIFEQETELNTQIATGLTPLAAREDTLYSYRHALVAVVNDDIVGALISYPGEYYHQMRNTTFRELPHFRELDLDAMPDEAGAGEYYIDTLAVLPQYRRRGIGRELMRTRIAWAEQNHPDLRISLLVDPENLIAQPLYESLGFTITDRNVVAFNHRFWKMIKVPF